ncbi:hypothetical protein [Maridesulfovibrio sp.]|uniref:hypothetical protein n=1 Tax=Maridesulfovibrio sp. TaxID=2795000 RepID=UPI0039EDF6CD
MSTPSRIRLAQCRTSRRTCDVPGCYKPSQKWGRYCETHDDRCQRTGHPQGHTVGKRELSPYLSSVNRFIEEHEHHPAIEGACNVLQRLLDSARPKRVRSGEMAPWQRTNNWLVHLRENKVTPQEMLATIVAMFLYQELDPANFRSDRHFRHQLVVRLLRLAPTKRDHATRFRQDRITVGVRDFLSERLCHSKLGALALRIAKHIAQDENQKNDFLRCDIAGYHVPFNHN